MPAPARLFASLLIAAIATGLPATEAAAQAVATWELVSPQRPIPRTSRGAAYDRVRKKLVMLGAGWGEGVLWEWDGARFQPWLPQAPRPDTQNAGVAFDGERNRLMLVAYNSLWELDGATQIWQELQPTGNRPPPRRRPLVAYGNKKLYVLGGENHEGVLHDLWSWDPATKAWTEHPGPPPSTLSRLTALWDADRGRLIVAFTSFNDHYDWNPATQVWTKHPDTGLTVAQVVAAHYDPTSKAVLFFGDDWSVWQWHAANGTFTARTVAAGNRSPRSWFMTGYDEERARFVLMGGTARIGRTDFRPERDDTWEWNPADNQWSHAAPARPHPGERALSAAIHLPKSGQVMVAGGGGVLDESVGPAGWLWDPSTRQWSAVASSTGPEDLWVPGLAYDAGRGLVVLFGGMKPVGLMAEDALWELDLTMGQWTRRTVVGPWPIPRHGAALAFDENRQLVLVQGGQDQGSHNQLTDHWEYNGREGTFQQRLTTGPPDGGPGSLFHDAARDMLVFVSSVLSVWERPRNSPSWALQGDFPTPRRFGAVAFDRVRRKILAHGGSREAAGLGPAADLWEWDLERRTWSSITIQGAAPWARHGHVLVFDPMRGSSFLYGGVSREAEDSSGAEDNLGDAWELTIGRLPGGERCQASHAGRCESGHCVNGRCCPSASGCWAPDGGVAGPPDALPDGPGLPPDAGAPDLAHDAGPVDGPPVIDGHARDGEAADAGVALDAPAPAIDTSGDGPPDGLPLVAPDGPAGPDVPSPGVGDALAAGEPAGPKGELYSSPGCAVARGPDGGAALLLLPVVVGVWRRWRRGKLARMASMARMARMTARMTATVTLALVTGAPPAGAAPVARWEPVAPPALTQPTAATYDTVRKRVVAIQQTIDDPQLWDWDGQRWTPWLPEAPRPDLRDGAITFDTARGRLVLVINERLPSSQDYQLVIWELDTTTRRWEKVEPIGKRPQARWEFTILYDPDRKGLYVMEGYPRTNSPQTDFLHDCWQWDGATRTWTERPWDQVGFHQGMKVYDPARARLVSPVTLGHVFEWAPADGTWQELGNGVAPYDQQIIAAGYDPVQKAVVAFGENREVWQWNPVTATFTVRVSALRDSPPRAAWGAHAYDAARGRFVFVGGFQRAPQTNVGNRDDTWEWEPTTNQWIHPRPAQPNPGAVSHASAVYLSGSDRILLVGGDRSNRDDAPAWIWRPDLRTWVLLTGSRNPPRALLRSGLGHDPLREVAVLFGGTSLAGERSDQLWELRLSDGQWSQPPITAGPSARGGAGLALHTGRRTMILHGGEDAAGALTDGWEWDAQAVAWRPRQASSAAPAGAGALFHDAPRNVLLFVTGGLAVWEGPVGEGAWTQVGQPPVTASSDAAAAFDPLRRKLLVWGGRDAITQKESAALWQWDVDGKSWSAIDAEGPAPRARYGHVLVHDQRRETFFLYGGRSSASSAGASASGALGDGWALTIGHLPAGERCTATHAGRCASGSCVNGTCCPSGVPCPAAPAPDASALAPDAGPPDATSTPPDVQPSPDRDATGFTPPDATMTADAAVAPDLATVPDVPDEAVDAALQPAEGGLTDLGSETGGPASGGANLYAPPGCSSGGSTGPVSPLLLLLLAARRRRRQ